MLYLNKKSFPSKAEYNTASWKTEKYLSVHAQPAESHFQKTLNSGVTHTAQKQAENQTLRKQTWSLNGTILQFPSVIPQNILQPGA